jgi:hypothetical protein
MVELEHQAEHWDTPEHGETGHLIAQAHRAAVDIARAGGLKCEHRVEAERNGSHAAARTPLRIPERDRSCVVPPHVAAETVVAPRHRSQKVAHA